VEHRQQDVIIIQIVPEMATTTATLTAPATTTTAAGKYIIEIFIIKMPVTYNFRAFFELVRC
jgi:hypothetical protein